MARTKHTPNPRTVTVTEVAWQDVMPEEPSEAAKAAPACPGCSGAPESPQAAISGCTRCGGLYTLKPVPRSYALSWVNLDRMAFADHQAKELRYFDFVITSNEEPNYRVHGWFDPATRLVVQHG